MVLVNKKQLYNGLIAAVSAFATSLSMPDSAELIRDVNKVRPAASHQHTHATLTRSPLCSGIMHRRFRVCNCYAPESATVWTAPVTRPAVSRLGAARP
jgi:hypothetical protein